MSKNSVSFDTEFNSTEERCLGIVCAVIRDNQTNEVFKFWSDDMDNFKKYFERLVDEGYNFIVFMAVAEIRFLLSIGYTREYLKRVKFVDIYPLWLMIVAGLEQFMYGKHSYIKNGKMKIIVTHKAGLDEKEDGWYEDEDGNIYRHENLATRRYNPSLAHACLSLLKKEIDIAVKDNMRDIILSRDQKMIEMFKDDIMEYCAMDTLYLFPLFNRCIFIIKKFIPDYNYNNIIKISRWMLNIAQIETNGIPISKEKILNFSSNYDILYHQIPEKCNEVYPFFRFDPKKNRYIKDYNSFATFVENLGIKWPKTPSGKYSSSKDTLDNFRDNLKEINAYLVAINDLRMIGYFSPNRVQGILKNIGTDGYLRTSLRPYGSRTSRNQPKPTEGYVFAMSRWMRTLVDDNNKIIIAADYSAQEIYLQAYISGDKNFMECYKSSDPYVWFAKKTGNIPSNVERIDGKYYADNVLVADHLQREYSNTRVLFKAIMLGVGYGMGIPKLAVKLTGAMINIQPSDIRTKILAGDTELLEKIKIVDKTEEHKYPLKQRASYYLSLHKKLFSTYHEFRANTVIQHKDIFSTTLTDGWAVIGKIEDNTVMNFPFQGGGQVILRNAVDRCLDANLKVINTLHDAIYIESTEDTKDEDIKTLVECMTKDHPLIRVGVEVEYTDWKKFESTWTEEKGFDDFEKFGKYFLETYKKNK